jgi:hypothetical protein
MVSEGGLQAWSAAAFAVGIERGVAGMKEVRFIGEEGVISQKG